MGDRRLCCDGMARKSHLKGQDAAPSLQSKLKAAATGGGESVCGRQWAMRGHTGCEAVDSGETPQPEGQNV